MAKLIFKPFVNPNEVRDSLPGNKITKRAELIEEPDGTVVFSIPGHTFTKAQKDKIQDDWATPLGWGKLST